MKPAVEISERIDIVRKQKTYREDEVKSLAGDDNDNDDIRENPGRHQFGTERLVAIVGCLGIVFGGCHEW